MMERHYATKARSSFRNSKKKCQRQMLMTYVRRWKMCDKPWPPIPQTQRTLRPRRKSYRNLHGKLHSRLISRVAAEKRHRKAKKKTRMKRSDQSFDQQNNTLVKFETDADRMRCLFLHPFSRNFRLGTHDGRIGGGFVNSYESLGSLFGSTPISLDVALRSVALLLQALPPSLYAEASTWSRTH